MLLVKLEAGKSLIIFYTLHECDRRMDRRMDRRTVGQNAIASTALRTLCTFLFMIVFEIRKFV